MSIVLDYHNPMSSLKACEKKRKEEKPATFSSIKIKKNVAIEGFKKSYDNGFPLAKLPPTRRNQ